MFPHHPGLQPMKVKWETALHCKNQRLIAAMEQKLICNKEHMERKKKQERMKEREENHHFLSWRKYFGGRVGTSVGGGRGGGGAGLESVRPAYVQRGVWASVEVGTKEQDARPLRNVYSFVASLWNSSLPLSPSPSVLSPSFFPSISSRAVHWESEGD